MNKVVHSIITLVGIGLLIAACGGGAALPAPTEAPAAVEKVTATEEMATTEASVATEEIAAEATEAPEATEEAAATEEPTATEAPVATEEAAAATEEAAAPAASKILRIRLPNEPQNGDPAFWIGPEEPIMLSVYEGLVSYKPGTWEVVNTLAESITPSEDGLKVEFKLKEGVQFHGGYGEVTAEDVKFSFERIAGLTDPPLESPYSGDWVALDHVEVTGKYTGEIILKEPFAALWTTTLPQSSGFILSKKAVEELGDDYATHPIGTGPYELVEWVTNERYVLKRFADYSGNNLDYADPVEWDEIRELPIIEYSPGEIALETDELDFSEILPESVERFKANDEFEIYERTTLDYLWVGMNVQNPKLQDINVRQAIRYAIDVPSIIDAAYDGKYARACALVVPGQLGEWADAPCYERDLDKAKEFMAMAGLETLDLTIRANENEDRRTIAEIVQANLAEIGINVEIEILDDAAMTDAHFGDTGFNEAELFVVNFITNPDPSWSTVWFLCDQVKVWNWMQYCNEEYDRLHFAALKEQDPAKRAEMYIQMQKIWDEAAHTVWIAYPILYWASRADIEPSLMPHGRILAWNFHSK